MMSADSFRIHWPAPVSDDDLLELNARNDALSFEREAGGDLLVTPPAGGNSSRRNAELTAQLVRWNQLEGCGVVFDSSAAFRLADTSVYGPDAAWVQAWKWEALTSAQRERFPPLAPDLVFEIVSRTDRLPASRERLDAFRRNGSALTVLIDPYRKRIEVNGEPRPWKPLSLDVPGCAVPFALDPRDVD
jgi:Uma2 family endonuclease